MKITASIIGALVLILVAAAAGFDHLLGSSCVNEILEEFPSPDRAYKAVAFQRDCGATTGFSTQISILRFGRSLDDGSGNIYVADADHGAAPSGPGGGPPVQVRWTGNRSLSVAGHPQARVFSSKAKYEDVAITYEVAE
ncbi:MAG: hypothetical protein ABWY94_02075 [Pseudoxanthomonas sp.]